MAPFDKTFLDRAAWFIHESNCIEDERDKSRDHIRALLESRDATGHVGAFLALMEIADAGVIPTHVDLLNAHVLLINEQYRGNPPDWARRQMGRWRTGGVSVGADIPPDADAVPALMRTLENRIDVHHERWDQRIDIESDADMVGDAVYTFLKVHPLFDGNGRISRLYAAALLHAWGLPVAVFTDHDKHGSFYPCCASDNPGLMRVYVRSKIVSPATTLSLHVTDGWIDTLPAHVRR